MENGDLQFLMRSIETHTFITLWGEFGVTLEDVSMLTSLPDFGEAQIGNPRVSKGENKERFDALMSFLTKFKYGTNKSTNLLWTRYFVEGNGKNSPYQHDVFLVY